MPPTFNDDAATIDRLISRISTPPAARASGDILASSALARRGPNRRRAARVSLAASNVSVLVGNELVAAIDLSTSGLQFHSPTRIVPGATILLTLRPLYGSPCVVLGRAMWSMFEKPMGSAPRYRVGVTFESADVRVLKNLVQQVAPGQPQGGPRAAVR